MHIREAEIYMTNLPDERERDVHGARDAQQLSASSLLCLERAFGVRGFGDKDTPGCSFPMKSPTTHPHHVQPLQCLSYFPLHLPWLGLTFLKDPVKEKQNYVYQCTCVRGDELSVS